MLHLPMMHRAGSFAPESYSPVDNTIELVWTTGALARQRVFTYDGMKEFDEELVVSPKAVRMDRLNAGAPLLNSHRKGSADDVLGSIVPGTARIERGVGLARVMLSRSETDAGIVQKIRDGVIRNVSAGYRVHAAEKVERSAGEVMLIRVVDWEPHEISALAVGADPGAQFRGAQDDAVYPCRLAAVECLGVSAVKTRMAMRQRSIVA